MFFKKNKSTPPPEAEHQAVPTEPALLPGQSLFAPGLNPSPAPIDFGFNSFPNQFDENFQMPTGPLVPWQPEAWKAPTAPEPENWAPPENPAPMASVVAPFEPTAQWEVPMDQTQAPQPFSPPLEQPMEQALQQPRQPVSDMTPEQAWSMLEPAPGGLPAEPEPLPLSEVWSYAPPAAPIVPETSQQDSTQEDWAAAFNDVPSSSSDVPEALSPYAPPLLEPTIEPVSPSVDIDQGWAFPTNLGPDLSAEAPLAPATQAFESYAASPWSAPSPEAELPTLNPVPSELEMAWANEASTPPPFEAQTSNLSADPINDNSFSPEIAAPLAFEGLGEVHGEAPVPPVDALWSGAAMETEESFQSQPPLQTFAQEQEQAPAMTPGYMELPELPSFKAVEPVKLVSSKPPLPEFDPIKASQELAAGWSQMEKTAPEVALAPEAVQLMPVEPQQSTWADEDMPPPMPQQQVPSGEWGSFPIQSTEPVYLHETPSTAQSEADLWKNLSTPEGVAPGEQVPLVSGAYMDAINQKLYPEDPFSGVNDEFAAGEQAFAEAAQFLFPETMSASLEWADESYELSNLDDSDEEGGVIDLGPSYMPQAQGFSQLSNEMPADFSTGFPNVSGLESEAFSGVAPREGSIIGISALSTTYEGSYNIDEEEVFSPSPYATDESLETPPVPLAVTPSFNGSQPVLIESTTEEDEDPFRSAWQTPTLEPYTEIPAIATPHLSTEPAALPPEAEWGYVQQDARSIAPQVEMPTPRLEQSWYTEDVLGASAAPVGAPDMLATSWIPQSFEAPMETTWEDLPQPGTWNPQPLDTPSSGFAHAASPQSLLESIVSEEDTDDFYATAYTLNEHGELVPVEDNDLFIQLESLAPQQVLPQVIAPPPQPPPTFLAPTEPESFEPAAYAPELLEEAAAPSWAPPAPDRSFPQQAVPEWVVPAPAESESFLAQPAYGEELPSTAWATGVEQSEPVEPVQIIAPQPVAEPVQIPQFSQHIVAPVQAPEPIQEPALPPVAAILPAATAASLSAFEMGMLMPPPYPAAPVVNAAPPVTSAMPHQAPAMPTEPDQAWHELAPPPMQEVIPQSPFQTQSQPQSQFQPTAQPIFPMEPPVVASEIEQPALIQPVASPEEALPPEKRVIHPKPLTRKLPSTAQEADMETQWYTSPEESLVQPIEASAQSTAQAAMALKLTLGNMEVMGLCQLSHDRRLLVVHNAGVYALMAQSGQDQPDVSVLKVFDHNPLAYQHTFTAVEEGQAAGQGMFVTQVGTWHAIISTFQDKITLHTELG